VAPLLEQPILALAYAVFVAGVVQLLFQLPFLARIHALPRPRWRPRHEGVRRAFKLMVPAIFGSSVAQINVLLSGIIASLLPVGSISYLYYSDRLMEFPLGLFGIALATVTLPYLSRLWATGERREFTETLEWSLKIALLIAVPAAVGLVVLAPPLIVTLFYGGEFDAKSVDMTVLALQAYAVGLVGFSYVKILAPAFFAREDTRTPVRIGIVALLANLVLGASSAWYLTASGFAGPHTGLAGATSFAAILNAGLLYRGLRKAGVIDHGAGWGALLMRVVLANGAMITVLLQLHRETTWWTGAALGQRVTWLAVSVAAGAGAYFLALLLLGMRPAQFRMRPS
jgi:putative peptidoglycan lipid II flippase